MGLYWLLVLGQALINPVVIIFGWAVGWACPRVWQLGLAAALVAPLIELVVNAGGTLDAAMLISTVLCMLALLAWAGSTFLVVRHHRQSGPVSPQRRGQLIALPVCLVAGAGASILGANSAVTAAGALAQWLDIDVVTSTQVMATAEPYGMLLFMLICGGLGWEMAGRIGRGTQVRRSESRPM